MRTPLVAAFLIAAPAIASAAPLAALSADVDGDGAPDAIELGTDGALHVHGSVVPIATAPTKATLAVAPIAAGAHGKLAILARVTTAHGDEAVIVTRGAGATWQIAWRGEVGGVGLDGEYQIEVAATPAGLVRYQSRFDVRRCDGKLALLFAEDFDGAKFVRATKLPVDLPPGAKTLSAHLDTQPASKPQLYQAHAASSHAGASNALELAIPRELDDGNPATAWRTDAPAEGQFFTFTPRGAATAHELRVIGGDHASKAALEAANRPRELAIVSEHGAWRVELPDAAHEPIGAAYVVELPDAVAGCVTVVVASTYGKPSGPTAISELEVFADGERAGGGQAMLAHTVAIDGPGARAMAQQLARGGASSLPAIDAELGRVTDAGGRRRLVRVLVEIHDAAAAPLLAHAATAGWVDGAELLAVAGALGALHQEHELHDLAAKDDLALDVRIAAASALDPGSADGLAALMELAGAGPRELRHAVIERLASGPSTALVAAAQAQAAPAPAAGDLWRAATRAARARPAERAAVLAAMSAALPAAADYERRYRLVDGVAALGDAPALATLTSWLGGLPAGDEAAALRQVAARALATSARPEALDLVLALVRDADPGVRLAALGALMQAGDAAAGAPGPWHAAAGADAVDRAIGARLARDSWSDVRVRAAQALGGRCGRPPAAAMLVAAVGADPALDVRAESLVSLVQCHAAGTAELLAHTWGDAKAPLALRTRAIALAVTLGDRALATKLVGELAAWRGAALESAPALALAVEAANAIGRLGAPGADAALLDALDDAAFPEIVGAAAAGLGALGPACSAAAKTKLGALARTDDPQVAIPARHAVAVCGKPAR